MKSTFEVDVSSELKLRKSFGVLFELSSIFIFVLA